MLITLKSAMNLVIAGGSYTLGCKAPVIVLLFRFGSNAAQGNDVH